MDFAVLDFPFQLLCLAGYRLWGWLMLDTISLYVSLRGRLVDFYPSFLNIQLRKFKIFPWRPRKVNVLPQRIETPVLHSWVLLAPQTPPFLPSSSSYWAHPSSPTLPFCSLLQRHFLIPRGTEKVSCCYPSRVPTPQVQGYFLFVC